VPSGIWLEPDLLRTLTDPAQGADPCILRAVTISAERHAKVTTPKSRPNLSCRKVIYVFLQAFTKRPNEITQGFQTGLNHSFAYRGRVRPENERRSYVRARVGGNQNRARQYTTFVQNKMKLKWKWNEPGREVSLSDWLGYSFRVTLSVLGYSFRIT